MPSFRKLAMTLRKFRGSIVFAVVIASLVLVLSCARPIKRQWALQELRQSCAEARDWTDSYYLPSWQKNVLDSVPIGAGKTLHDLYESAWFRDVRKVIVSGRVHDPDRVFAALGKLSQLQELLIFDCPVNNERLLDLRDHSELQMLMCSEGQVDCSVLSELSCQGRLTAMVLPLANFDPEDVDSLLEFRGLQLLSLSGTNLDDGALCRIASLPDLRVIFIERCPVGEAGLMCCGESGTIRKVVVARGQFSDATLLAVRAKFPELVVEVRDGTKR